MKIRTDYTTSIVNGSPVITFSNPIRLEKVIMIVNLSKNEVIYSVQNPVKNKISVEQQNLFFAMPPNVSQNDTLHIVYDSDEIQTEQIKAPITKDSLASLVISQDFLTKVGLGLVSGYSLVLKSGRNLDVDTGTVPEDVWNGGGIYTGFPLTSDTLQIFSSSASDTGTLTFLYLESDTATSYTQATRTLTGTTPVNTGISAYRVHSAFYTPPAPNTATGSNAGVITIRHLNTPANVFLVMPIGTNQSYMGGYTIPFGNVGLLLKSRWAISGAASTYADVALYTRAKNQGFRLRRNNTAVFGSNSIEDISGGVLLPELTDIMPRVNVASASNMIVVCSYDILQISTT